MTLSNSKLALEIFKTIELMASVELLIIFSVAAFYFSVMFGSIWTNQLVSDSELSQCNLKQSSLFFLVAIQAVSKFKSVVCLNALNGIWKLFNHILDKLRG